MNRKSETQERILRAAAELFAAHGYHRTSVAAIAASAEVSRATVFWHFGDKLALFREVCRRLLIPFGEELEGSIAHLEPRKRVLEYLSLYERFAGGNRRVVAAFVRWALESAELRAEVRGELLALHGAFARDVASALEELLGDGEQARALASGLVSLLDGNLLLDLLDGNEEARRQRHAAARSLAERLLRTETGR